MGGSLVDESLGNLETVNAVDPVEVFSDVLGFIALKRPNEVPAGSACRRRTRGALAKRKRNSLNLLDTLLDIVLTKVELAGLDGLQHSVRSEGFAHGHEANGLFGQSMGLAGLLNSGLDLIKRLGDVSHGR
jgi:hypothetical protein